MHLQCEAEWRHEPDGLLVKVLQGGLGLQTADRGEGWEDGAGRNDYNLDPNLEVCRSVISGCDQKLPEKEEGYLWDLRL